MPKSAKIMPMLLWGILMTFGSLVWLAALSFIVLRGIGYKPFSTPSESMSPSLILGDYILAKPVRKLNAAADLDYGDVVFFRHPRNGSFYVKRIAALPNDKIQFIGGKIVLNGIAIKSESLGNEAFMSDLGQSQFVEKIKETLPNGKSYNVYDMFKNGPLDDTVVFTVPDGHYFLLGDNRDNSTDSRVPLEMDGIGFVPKENIIFMGGTIIVSFERKYSSAQDGNYGIGPRLDRILKEIE